MPVEYTPTTDRPKGTAPARIAAYFAENPNARLESNRHIARQCRVDEQTVRAWKKKHGIPPLDRQGRPVVNKPKKVKKK